MKNSFICGMDVSFLDEIEQGGGKFYDGDHEMDCLDIVQRSAANSIRLRIWNDPPGGYCNLERTLIMARRIKQRNMHFLLDFHYSDKWADPANQWKPSAWEKLDLQALQAAVYQYTEEVLLALKEQGTLPDMVQIGNEVTPGMLWNEGRVGGEFDTEKQWKQFAELLKSGIAAAKAADPGINVMIHIDRGGDAASSRAFYDRIQELGVSFDTIGLSYYPWWHGTLEDLRGNLSDLAVRYDKDIVVVETAYPWTLQKPEGLGFIVDKEDQLHKGYPATVEGQSRYMKDFVTAIKQTPNGRGIGFHYWEPCWIPSQASWSVGHANNWSNLTLFDFSGVKLDSLGIWNTFASME